MEMHKQTRQTHAKRTETKRNYAKKSYRILVTRKRDERITWDDDGKQTENKKNLYKLVT